MEQYIIIVMNATRIQVIQIIQIKIMHLLMIHLEENVSKKNYLKQH